MKKTLFLCILLMGSIAQAQNLKEAQKAIQLEQFDKAKTILENLVKKDTLNGENYFHLGSLYLTIGEDALAIATFNKGAGKKKGGNLNYIGLGQYSLDDNKSDEAQAYFDKAMIGMGKKSTKEFIYIAQAFANSFNPNYEKAAEYAKKAIAINHKLPLAHLVLGDALYNLDDANGAYSAYRNAFDYDNDLLRAKLNLAIIVKKAWAFFQAEEDFNEIITENPGYGPAYRELAETYYLWSLVDKEKYDTFIAKAVAAYGKFVELTGYSLTSRMRYADFLILAKDYKALEKEATEMQKIDDVNPRILRYLGYSACENGNYQEAVASLNTFLSVVEPKRVIGFDYIYLAKAEMKLAVAEDGNVSDYAGLERAIDYLKQAIEKEAVPDNEFSDFGKKLFNVREYYYASKLFDALMLSPKSTLLDKLYYANSVFYNAAAKDANNEGDASKNEEIVAYQEEILKADRAFGDVTTEVPTTQDAYFNRARLSRYVLSAESEANEVKYFEDYIKVVMEKGEEEIAKSSVSLRLSEAYTAIAALFAETDKKKAIENFEQALKYDPSNDLATRALKFLKNNK